MRQVTTTPTPANSPMDCPSTPPPSRPPRVFLRPSPDPATPPDLVLGPSDHLSDTQTNDFFQLGGSAHVDELERRGSSLVSPQYFTRYAPGGWALKEAAHTALGFGDCFHVDATADALQRARKEWFMWGHRSHRLTVVAEPNGVLKESYEVKTTTPGQDIPTELVLCYCKMSRSMFVEVDWLVKNNYVARVLDIDEASFFQPYLKLSSMFDLEIFLSTGGEAIDKFCAMFPRNSVGGSVLARVTQAVATKYPGMLHFKTGVWCRRELRGSAGYILAVETDVCQPDQVEQGWEVWRNASGAEIEARRPYVDVRNDSEKAKLVALIQDIASDVVGTQ